jgi:hypothetical protein
MSIHNDERDKTVKQWHDRAKRDPALAEFMRTGALPQGEYETMQPIKRHPTCMMTNCRRRTAKDEPFCTEHRDKKCPTCGKDL